MSWNVKNISASELDAGGFVEFSFEVLQDGEVLYPNAKVYCLSEERDAKIVEWVRCQKDRIEAIETMTDELDMGF